MEHQLWKAISAVLKTLGKPRQRRANAFTDHDLVAVSYWAVIHDRPQRWACHREHWPLPLQRRPLPAPGTLSRRLRTPSVVALLDVLERRVLAPKQPGLFWMIDGKPLAVGGCSKDRQAGYGRAARAMAKGYKIHVILDPTGAIARWRLAPMPKEERVMAQRMLRVPPIQGYVAADSNDDSNKLHEVCDQRDQLRLVARRRCGPDRGVGHRKHSVGRLRAIA